MCGCYRKVFVDLVLFRIRHFCIEGDLILHEMNNFNTFKCYLCLGTFFFFLLLFKLKGFPFLWFVQKHAFTALHLQTWWNNLMCQTAKSQFQGFRLYYYIMQQAAQYQCLVLKDDPIRPFVFHKLTSHFRKRRLVMPFLSCLLNFGKIPWSSSSSSSSSTVHYSPPFGKGAGLCGLIPFFYPHCSTSVWFLMF